MASVASATSHYSGGRLRRRDREDFLLRMEILKINPTAEVLDNLTEGRWREHGCDSRPKCKRALVNDRGAGDGRLQSSAE